MKKIFSLTLALSVMLTSCAQADVSERIILGSSTELTGDFRFPGYGGASAGAADQDIAVLTTGYAVMETNPAGEYVWNETAVKSHTEEVIPQPDGSQNYRITIELKEGMTFSDGTPVTADNYLAYLLAFSTVVAQSAGATGMAGQAFVGYADFFNYAGDGVKVDENAPASREFAGLRRLSDYCFSIEADGAAGYYPYFYADTYAAVTPYDLGLILGDGVTVRDDGNGCYLAGNWYEQASGSTAQSRSFVKTVHMQKARYDTSVYPYTGPYTITEWDEGTRQVVLTKNDAFLGNFEGQKPSVQTVVYTRIASETQFDQLTSGAVDILSGITGGDETKAALQVVGQGFLENHYLRAGYGKIQFDCDFGPTLFPEVRQAVALLLDRASFATTFTGGYGKVVNGPYSEDSWMYLAARDTLEDTLDRYDYSLSGAKSLLEQGGWVYNSRGEAYTEGADGTDRVRYKKITREELESLTTPEGTEATVGYRSVGNTDNIVYQTIEIDGAYYIPLVLNWFSTENNAVSDLIATMLMSGSGTAAAGMVIRRTTGDFNSLLGELHRDPSYGYGGVVTYGMYNLATGFTSPVYDYSFQWSRDPAYFSFSAAKLYDEHDAAFPYYKEDGTHERLSYEDAVRLSGGQLGMDYLSMAMVYDAVEEDEYVKWWTAYIQRWNELLPEIPLYCNYYYDVYRETIQDYHTSPYWGTAEAILYCRG
ncbi:MAG: hypothetical protein IJP32_01730 [Clostridia bacterium]|nr:hypothetical protein [Clostridia bacterium]MBQ9995065.1 hypothetical protein [Clostridia bacterium]